MTTDIETSVLFAAGHADDAAHDYECALRGPCHGVLVAHTGTRMHAALAALQDATACCECGSPHAELTAVVLGSETIRDLMSLYDAEIDVYDFLAGMPDEQTLVVVVHPDGVAIRGVARAQRPARGMA